MSKAIFVTATGTDIGKTYVSGLLVKKMRNLGYNCGYFKPALSGARVENGNLFPGDCEFVVNMASLNVNPKECVAYCFKEAVSPHLAAERQGIIIELSKIQEVYENLSESFDYLVVEGAGGITCPFNLQNKPLLLPDVIKGLGLDIVIVADGGLGTINSVLLTVEYAKSHNLKINGIILNNFDENNFMHIDNKLQVERLTGVKVIATVASGDKDLNITNEDMLGMFDLMEA